MLNQKLFKVIGIVGLLLWKSSLFAQKNNIKLTPVLGNKINLSYERELTTSRSIQVNLKQYFVERTSGGLLVDRQRETISGTRLSTEIRFYSGKQGINGFYIAPQGFIGRHQVSFREEDNSSALGTGLGLLLVGIDIVSDGDLDHTSLLASEITTIEGRTTLNVYGLGLNIGYQKTWKNFALDMGTSLSKSNVFDNQEGIPLNDGNKASFHRIVDGVSLELYFGLGIAF